MLILRHNTLSAEELFIIETTMLKVSDDTHRYELDHSVLNLPKSKLFGLIMGIFQRLEICQTLGITMSEFLDFLIDIQEGYKENPYHSFYHAVDITMVLYHMLIEFSMAEHLTQMDIALLMTAALCHDIGHPGKNNHFEVCCKTKLAQQFNDLSVLESQSCILTMALLDKHHILDHTNNIKEMKQMVIKMILATDMVCHFTLEENISALRHKVKGTKVKQRTTMKLKPLWDRTINKTTPFDYFEKLYFAETTTTTTIIESKSLLDATERLMLCKILIHAADISNPCRPWKVFNQLSRLVCIEFFRQGQEEERLGLEISPNMDPRKANPSTINVGFIDFIVQPYFETLSHLFPKCQPLIIECTKNRGEWLKLSSEPVEALLSVTTSAGIVNIPQEIERTVRNKLNRSVSHHENLSTQRQQQSDINNTRYARRKSEDILLFATRKHRKTHQSSISIDVRKVLQY